MPNGKATHNNTTIIMKSLNFNAMTDNNIRPMTVSELAQRWGVSPRTVKRWLKPFAADIGPRVGNLYTSRQVAIIISKLE